MVSFENNHNTQDQSSSIVKAAEDCQRIDELGRLSEIMDANPVPCFVIDSTHHIVYWNKGCEHVLGLPSTQMLGTRDQWKAFYDMPRATLADLIVDSMSNDVAGNNLYKSKSIRRSEIISDAFEAEDFFPKLGKDGRWLFFTAAPVRNANGEIIGAVETLQDTTRQRKAEIALQESHTQLEQKVAERTAELAETNQRLAASLKKAEEVNQMKTAFLATVSHELKTPLNGIIGFSDLIAMDHPDDSDGDFARLIKKSGQKLFDLVSEMLEITAIKAGEAEVSINPGSVKELLDGLMQEYSMHASKKGITLSVRIPDDTESIIYTDIQRIRDLLSALIDNAIRYMDKPQEGTIELAVGNDAEGFRFCVKDNGPGSPPGSEMSIFEKFRQLGSHETRCQDGLGLGLALARAQAELLGGSLNLETPPGQAGALFVVRIPSRPE